MRAVVIAGGEIHKDIDYKADTEDFIICADGGYHNALILGIRSTFVIGDFDSLGQIPKGVETVKHPAKDRNRHAFSSASSSFRGYNDILLLGAMGGRADHSANICLLKLIVDRGAKDIF